MPIYIHPNLFDNLNLAIIEPKIMGFADINLTVVSYIDFQ